MGLYVLDILGLYRMIWAACADKAGHRAGPLL